MSQLATLQELDAALAAAFLAAGLADSATYTPPAGAAVACTVLIDRAAQFYDDAAGVAGNRIVITLYVAEVAVPVRTAAVVIGSETFKLDQLIDRDESMSRWVVVRA